MRFSSLPLDSFYTYHGIHRRSHLWYTVTTCLTSCRSTGDAPAHCRHPTANLAPTNITRGHPAFLQIPAYTRLDRKQFLLLIDLPIQDRAHQITIQQIFSLDIPHRNYLTHYDINTRYFRVTKDATMGVELSTAQFQICQQANGQFCHISTPFQPLANPPTCIAALYAKSRASIDSKFSLQLCKTTTTTLPTQITACSATSAHFYLPPRYETPVLNVNVSLDMANLKMINITALHFHIWQHLGNNQSDIQLQHLATIPSILVHKIYQHLLNSTMQLTPFNTEPSEDTDSLWNVFSHPGIYVSALGLLIPVGIGLFCCYFFWCQPARLAC